MYDHVSKKRRRRCIPIYSRNVGVVYNDIFTKRRRCRHHTGLSKKRRRRCIPIYSRNDGAVVYLYIQETSALLITIYSQKDGAVVTILVCPRNNGAVARIYSRRRYCCHSQWHIQAQCFPIISYFRMIFKFFFGSKDGAIFENQRRRTGPVRWTAWPVRPWLI